MRKHTHTHTIFLLFFPFFFLKTMIPWRLLVFFPCQCLSNSKVLDIFLLPWPSLAVSMLFSNREWHINDSLYRVWCATLRGPQPPYGQHPSSTPSPPPPTPTLHMGGGPRLEERVKWCVTCMTNVSAYVGANSNRRRWPLKKHFISVSLSATSRGT